MLFSCSSRRYLKSGDCRSRLLRAALAARSKRLDMLFRQCNPAYSTPDFNCDTPCIRSGRIFQVKSIENQSAIDFLVPALLDAEVNPPAHLLAGLDAECGLIVATAE